MQIIAYINSSDNDVMQKSLSEIGTFTVKPTEQLELEKPNFVLNYSSSLIGCNYIRCPDYGRYYFATVRTKPGNEAIIECTGSDPLMSFSSYILNCDILTTRAESIGQPTHYKDSMLPVYPSKKNITSIVMQHAAAPLSGDLSTSAEDCYLLTVLGGQPNINERGENNGESESERLGDK